MPLGLPYPQITVRKGHWGLSVTAKGRVIEREFWPPGWPQVGPSAVPPRGTPGVFPTGARGVTALTTASSSRAHRPAGLRAIASLRRALASGPRRRILLARSLLWPPLCASALPRVRFQEWPGQKG